VRRRHVSPRPTIPAIARIDYDRAASTYDEGRAHPLAAFAEWRDALVPHLEPGGEHPILDLGAGTGIWSTALTTWFGVPVVAVEPAAGMRFAAASKGLPASVRMLAGRGEAIPLRSATCGLAWLSTVIHHVADLPACAAELRRVLRPGRPVLIRSSFAGRQDEIPLFRFFPTAARVAGSFPTVEQAAAAFATAGYSVSRLARIREVRGGGMAEWVDRIRAMRHADSTLAPLTDEEFASGLAALERATAAGEPVPPTGLDLLVLSPDDAGPG
jgi:ubiquinone/menaquinone biosynthesis C-methylase UbiE